MLKVLIVTGGTAGHLFPAQQLQKQLQNCEVLFAGHKLKSSPFFDRSHRYCEIDSSNRKIIPLLKGIYQSIRLLFRFKPDVVVGFGSFHSFPTLFASFLLRKKIVLFEANCSFGKVNQLFAPFAKKIALQFPIFHKKGVYVPLLPWTKKTKSYSVHDARAFYGLEPDLFTILVFGGSQGASFINETFCKAALLLDFPFQVIHLTGKEDPKINYPGKAAIKPFEQEMDLAYAAADMVVCRCGASTIAELIRSQLPAVLIPYPLAHNHQIENGKFLKEGARLLLQKEATPMRLAQEIIELKKHLKEHKKKLQEILLPKTIDFGLVVQAVGEKK
jgi:UDP-N-acetylglucosamine--N-acetylmuramyl-(pentapeptide) pyrophosphoryl-undecaprenol N-acetylglucosamine transferase